jgi:hypothetical protein
MIFEVLEFIVKCGVVIALIDVVVRIARGIRGND